MNKLILTLQEKLALTKQGIAKLLPLKEFVSHQTYAKYMRDLKDGTLLQRKKTIKLIDQSISIHEENVRVQRRLLRSIKKPDGNIKNEQTSNLITLKNLKADNKIQKYYVTGILPIIIREKTKQSDGTYKIENKTIFKKVTSILNTSINKIKKNIQYYAEQEVEIDIHYDTDMTYGKFSELQIKAIGSKNISAIKLGHKKHSYKFLENADKVNINEGECVIDYILYELAGKHGFKKLNRESLIKEFKGLLVSTNQIIEWAKKYNNLSIYAIDPLMKVFNQHKANHHDYTLCFIVNNNHLYPILDSDTKQSIAQSGKLKLNDYKFNVSYDSFEYYSSIENNFSTEKNVILIEDDMSRNIILELMETVQNQTMKMIDNIKFNNGKPIAFRHPETNQVYEVTTKFDDRKNIIKTLANKYGSHLVDFKNQSYTQISQLIFDNEFGNTSQLKSNLSNKLYDIFETYPINPYCATTTYDQTLFSNNDDAYGFDVCKSYSSVLIYNDSNYPIFQQFDEPQPFNIKSQIVTGEYFINKEIKLCNDLMLCPKGFYPSNFVKYLISNKIISKHDITCYIPSKQFIKADIFNKFVIYVYEAFSESDAKIIINNFIGDLGTKYIKSDVGCVTSSFEIAMSLLMQEQDNKNNVSLDSYNNLHFVRIKNKQPKYNTGLPIHRHIFCSGIINLCNLYKKIHTSTNQVICFNTD